jgi:hypothetical protein
MTTNNDALLKIRDTIQLVLLDLLAEDEEEVTEEEQDTVAELTDILLEALDLTVASVEDDKAICYISLNQIELFEES